MQRETFLKLMTVAGVASADDRIRAGIVGSGNRWHHLMGEFKEAGVELASTCDVSEPSTREGAKIAPGARSCDDYRRMLDDKPIGEVIIATLDHWHCRKAIGEVEAGKDVYKEKFFALTVEEGFRLMDAVRRTERVLPVGRIGWIQQAVRKQLILNLLLVMTTCWVMSAQSSSDAAKGATRTTRVAPTGWFAGDPHIHRGMLCGRDDAKRMLSPDELKSMMEVNGLDVISVLGDMGNGECRDAAEDLKLITGEDHPSTKPGRLMRWDAEWHFDPKGVTYEQKAIGGHLIALGLKSGQPMFREYTYPIIKWAQDQGGVVGFAHMQYLKNGIPDELDCCTPLEYPVEVALTPKMFLMEDVRGSGTAIAAYYRLLNCGFRPGISAGTDYPCYENGPVPLGDMLTYVRIPDGRLTYRKWIDGIAAGRTVVSRTANNEFLDVRVNRGAGPGDEIRLGRAGAVDVEVAWTTRQPADGTIELVQDGVVVATQKASASPKSPSRFSVSLEFAHSGWVCARQMGKDGHLVHTAAVFIAVGGKPIRTSFSDAEYFVRYLDSLLEKTSEGGPWAAYFKSDREAAQARYREARAMYARIAAEARGLPK